MENEEETTSPLTPNENRQTIAKMATAIDREVAEGIPLSPVDERILAMRERLIEDVILTTETDPKLCITKRIEILTAQSVFEISNFKDLTAGAFKPLKGNANKLDKQLEELRAECLRGLKRKAFDVGANAVVGVDLDLSTISIGQISMMMMMASGTSVLIEY